MNKEIVIKELDELIAESLRAITSYDYGNPTKFIAANTSLRAKSMTFLKSFLPEDSEQINTIKSLETKTHHGSETLKNILIDIKEYVNKDYISTHLETAIEPMTILQTIFSRFHKVARGLKRRYKNRDTLIIKDEYDVQDLLHSLLLLHFNVVRTEEWTPSYAGSSSRMDFLLKDEKIVIEVKKSRETMTDKDLGNQLIVDIERYQEHPDCETVICFVYDPEGVLGNPTAIANDLNKRHNGFVEVIIKPD